MSDTVLDEGLARERRLVFMRVLHNRVRELESWESIQRYARHIADRGVPPAVVVRIILRGYRWHINVLTECGDLVSVAWIVRQALCCGVPREYLQQCLRAAMNRTYGHLMRP